MGGGALRLPLVAWVVQDEVTRERAKRDEIKAQLEKVKSERDALAAQLESIKGKVSRAGRQAGE